MLRAPIGTEELAEGHCHRCRTARRFSWQQQEPRLHPPSTEMLIGYKRRGEGEKWRKEGRGKNTEAPIQWENTTIQRGQDETSPVQHCPVKLAALYYSQLALSSSVVLALFLKDNFTFDPLSSETLLKVPACYYEQKSSVNAEMLYPLLLPPCHRRILKHDVIKKGNICWGCSIPSQQQSLRVERPPRACTASDEGRLLLLPSWAFLFLLFLLSPPRGRTGCWRVPRRARATPQ